jgi:dTDP-4-dehydrorhamnose 3,5-epimerase
MTLIAATSLPEVLILTARRFGDERVWFCVIWNLQTLAQAGCNLPDFVQDNHSFSAQPGTLRGLHYQRPPLAQAKLVRCSRGAILDVVVDIRRGSPHYGQWAGVERSAENGQQLFVPAAFLNGFITGNPDCELQYKCSDTYLRGLL